MSVLILKNIVSEGPGTIEDFLRDRGHVYRIVDMQDECPPSHEGYSTLVILGGPMSVNEEDIYPYITAEIGMVKEFIGKGKKVLGICLGAQIMAKALGARVYAGRQKEIGWYDIEFQEGGIRDALMNRLAVHAKAGDFWKKLRVFHWHGETFDLPEGAEWLAKSELYPHQAFRYGNRAYAFQFHIEVTRDMIFQWLRDEAVDLDLVKRDTELYYDDYAGRAINFYKAFFDKST